jgi:hypothetical protein
MPYIRKLHQYKIQNGCDENQPAPEKKIKGIFDDILLCLLNHRLDDLQALFS